jgi:hypothetical protein
LLCGTLGVALAREKKLNVLTNLEGALRPVRFELRRQKAIILRSLVFAILFLVCLPLQFESREVGVCPRSVARISGLWMGTKPPHALQGNRRSREVSHAGESAGRILAGIQK